MMAILRQVSYWQSLAAPGAAAEALALVLYHPVLALVMMIKHI